jgi:hypothetical protein
MWSYVRWLILPDLGSERCASSRWGFSESTSGATRERQVVRAAKRRSNLAAYTAIAAIAALMGGSGCTDLAPEDDTCTLVEGCVPPPEPYPPEWSCIEEAPIQKGDPPDVVALVLFVVDFANPLVVPPMLKLTACFPNDGNCGTPFADPARGLGVAGPPLAPIQQALMAQDPSGTLLRAAQMMLLPPSVFDGFIRMEAENYAKLDYVLLDELELNLEPIVELPNPMGGPPTRVAPLLVDPIGLPRLDTLDSFYTRLNETQDDSKATTVARTFNCDGERAADVGLEADVAGSRWAFLGGIPRAGDDRVTDAQGIIGYANLEPVGLGLSALDPIRQDVYREASIPAQAGIISTLEMRPPNARKRQLNITLRPQPDQQE